MSNALDLLTLQFLAWVGERRRSYAEAMEAWRTSCPRMPVWENAVDDELVRLTQGKDGALVELTQKGWAMLDDRAGAA